MKSLSSRPRFDEATAAVAPEHHPRVVEKSPGEHRCNRVEGM